MKKFSNITIEEVRDIAALARLGITEEEAVQAAEKLDQILENFSIIQAIDTATVPPADDVTGQVNITRPDVAKPEILAAHQALLTAAPETHAGHVKVKAVF